MNFEVDRERQDELGAPVDDVAQEAIDATATAYANDAGIDVEQHLRVQLSGRGVVASDAETIDHIGREIRAGHDVSVGRPDGSVDPRP